MQFIIQNWEQIFTGVTAAVALASVVSRFTPSDIDNKIIDKIADIINIVAINKPRKD
jgi:hypothetical protein